MLRFPFPTCTRAFRIWSALIWCSSSAAISRAKLPVHEADVVVYGATPGGVCAALAAAHEGVSVVLVEPSRLVGGVMSGGLSLSDSNQMMRTALKGLFEDIHYRIEDDYKNQGVKLNYSVAVKDQTRWTYEPHVAERVMLQMLKEVGVRVYFDQVLSKVEKTGNRMRGMSMIGGATFVGKTYVDATYEGDLMAAAGVSWVIGRESRNEFGETFAGKQYPKAAMRISGFDADGKLLPLINTAEPGPDEEGDRKVMTYSFRLCLTKEPNNRVPFPKPAHYDANRFELIRRYYKETKNSLLLWDLYELPRQKVDANNGIGKQISMGLVGGADRWCEAGLEERAKIWEAHKQYILEQYHFLTTDPAVPQRFRDELAAYGLCKDEFAAYGHWSPQLYVREGRRMRGEFVLTQYDILIATRREKTDSIGIASFPIDSHDVQRIARGPNEVVNEGTIFMIRVPGSRQGPAFQIPYRAITPRREECSNLLVPVALSATKVAYCSLRVEPAWMIIGQSAGIAAALAASMDSPVQTLPYGKLRERLLAQRQVLDFPAITNLPP